jgi:hypothetical protein
MAVSPLFVAVIWFVRTRWRKMGQGFIRIGVAPEKRERSSLSNTLCR